MKKLIIANIKATEILSKDERKMVVGGSRIIGDYLISKINHRSYDHIFFSNRRKIPIGSYLTDTIYQHPRAVPNGYSGKVYMLVSNKISSAGSDAAREFRLAKFGRIISEKSESVNPCTSTRRVHPPQLQG
jgi:hypothetical protein